MIRKVLVEEAETLAKLARQTFRETFSYDNTEEQLQSYFSEAYDYLSFSIGEFHYLSSNEVSVHAPYSLTIA